MRKWDEGEHEGCGIDSYRAFEKWKHPMIVKTYDPACYALAEHFMQDEPVKSGDPQHYKKLCDDLAKEIQQTIEDWFDLDDDMAVTSQHHSTEAG